MQLTFEPGKPFRRIRLNEPERAATLTNRPIALGGGISGVYCLKQANDALMFTRAHQQALRTCKRAQNP
jgi:hypothetical protein